MAAKLRLLGMTDGYLGQRQRLWFFCYRQIGPVHFKAGSIEDDVMHGEPVFEGTRMPVEDAIESYYACREVEGMSDEEAITAVLDSFRTIPGPGALRFVQYWMANLNLLSVVALTEDIPAKGFCAAK